MSVFCTMFIKEADKFKPFLKFGSAAKDPMLAFAFTVICENSINSTVRRIYSGHSDCFFEAIHFSKKNDPNIFWPIKIFRNLRIGLSWPKIPGFFGKYFFALTPYRGAAHTSRVHWIGQG